MSVERAAALTGAQAYDVTGLFGVLRIDGATRLDFVHRMSSGAVKQLIPGTGARTCFTTPIGRIVDASIVLCRPDALLLLTGGGNADKLRRWLAKYVFFNDDLKLTDATESYALSALSIDAAPSALSSAPLFANVDGDGAIAGELFVRAPLGLTQFALRLSRRIADAAADLGGVDAFDQLRVAHGEPRFPNEFGEDVIPLEAGLWDAVSFSKGCYIGQEVIARMESRNQIAKKLVRLSVLDGAFSAGQPLTLDGAAAGRVTSAAGPYAMGYLRTALIEVGRIVSSDIGRARIEGLVERR